MIHVAYMCLDNSINSL